MKNIADKHKIIVWPDYEWCYYDELWLYSHKSDDYSIAEIAFEEEPTNEQLRAAIEDYDESN